MEIFSPYIIFFLNLALIFFYSLNPNNKKGLFLITVFLWVFISGFRDYSIGADTFTYMISFYEANELELASIIDGLYDFFTGNTQKDYGYTVIEKVLGSIYLNYTFFLLFISFLFHFFLFRLVYIYSDNTSDFLISALVYGTLFYAFFALTGQRQVIATAIGLLLNFSMISKRHLLIPSILILIAATVHKSALLIFLAVFATRVKMRQIFFPITIVLFILLMLFREEFSTIVKIISGYNEYGINQNSGTFVFTTLYLAVFSVLFYIYKDFEKKYRNSLFLKCFLIGLVFIPLTFVNPSAMRVVQYFSIFIIFLIPRIKILFNDEGTFYRICIIFIMILSLRNTLYFDFI